MCIGMQQSFLFPMLRARGVVTRKRAVTVSYDLWPVPKPENNKGNDLHKSEAVSKTFIAGFLTFVETSVC